MAVAMAAMTAAAMDGGGADDDGGGSDGGSGRGGRQLCLEADHALSWGIHPPYGVCALSEEGTKFKEEGTKRRVATV